MPRFRTQLALSLATFLALGSAMAQNVEFYEYARDAHKPISGKLSLRLTIDAAGYPQNIQVARSSGSRNIDQAAVSWLQQQRLHPVSQNGETRSFHTLKEIKYSNTN